MESDISLYTEEKPTTDMGKVKITIDGYSCERCGHKWIPRTKSYPRVCPDCKSPYWDKARTKAK